VILVDTNLLVYASVPSMVQNTAAREWLDSRLNKPAPVGLPWPSLLGFLRAVTNPRVFDRPEPVQSAWAQVESWLGCPNVWIPQPTEKHQAVLAPLLNRLGTGANLIPDAHLAALALEHGLILCSSDGDFARFSGLRWETPLASPAS